ncbi:ADP-glucose phosphorylase [Syzygium oleosum]|uniref:ADP-glucose phosphorylase n=1 Tax=Syzygium oleosum TaxID=219896 RepID=UPI0024B9B7F2|nr:ADP-glucose phosphorylase [Syzygium oleosum]
MASQNRLPQLRKDEITGRWVIFSPARAKRPSDFKSKAPVTAPDPGSDHRRRCPFCSGNEHLCAPQIFRVPPDPSSDWTIRVIENLYPALDRNLRDADLDGGGGGADVLRGFGFHDVVIETPDHSVQLSDLSPREVGDVILACKKRIQQLVTFDSIKYVQVFKNHGASAGASLSHSHSQIIALPIVPSNVSARIECQKEHFDRTGKCCLCEVQLNELLIDESAHFVSFVPFAATFAFEIWIAPRDHSPHFHELDDDKAADLGGILKLMLRKICIQLNDPPFNFMIQTSPVHTPGSELCSTHWYLQIVPQLTIAAGFEVATGCHINPVFPEEAAKVLREVHVQM